MDPEKRKRREMGERRKMRIKQVRCQEKQFASQVRDNYQQTLAKERATIAAHLKCQYMNEQEQKRQAADLAYQQSLMKFGRSHSLAVHTNIEQANDDRVRKLLDARQRADERHALALQNLQENRRQAKQSEQWRAERKKQVQLEEKERAARVVARPLPPSQDIILNLAVSKGHRVHLTNVEGYSTTYHHLAAETAHRETPSGQHNAYKAADQIEDVMRKKEEATAREQQERDEKAWLRHQHACKEIRLKRDYSEMMNELAALERADRLQRQKGLQRLPKRVFVPPHRRMEEAAELQREMERAFEEIAVYDEECHNDLDLKRSLDGSQTPTLFVGPPPPVSSGIATPQETSEPDTGNTQTDATATDGQMETETTDENEPPDRLVRHQDYRHVPIQEFDPIQLLLERVRAQRRAWTDYHHRETMAGIQLTLSGGSGNDEGTATTTTTTTTTTATQEEEKDDDDDDDNDSERHLVADLKVPSIQAVSVPVEDVSGAETDSSSVIVDEKEQQQHAVDLSVSEKQPTEMGWSVAVETAESDVVPPDGMDSSQQTDRLGVDIAALHREADQRVSSTSVSSGVPISSSVDFDVTSHRPVSAKYETPEVLLQHIHKQRRQYEKQRDLIASQYSSATTTSSTLANARAQHAAIHPSLSHQRPSLLSHSQFPIIPVAIPSTLHDDLLPSLPNSGSSPLQHASVSVPSSPHLASSAVPFDSHSLAVSSVQSAPVEKVSMAEANAAIPTAQSVNFSGQLSTHQSSVDDVTSPLSIAKSHSDDQLFYQMVTGEQQWENEAVDVDVADLTSSHGSDVGGSGTEASVSMSDLVAQARTSSEQVTDFVGIDNNMSPNKLSQWLDRPSMPQTAEHLSVHQHSPPLQQLVISSSALPMSPFRRSDVQPHSQHLPHSLMAAGGVEEQVDIPPAIVLPSSGSHSPNSSGSGSLIDLSQCVDFSQAFREPGDGCQLLDIEDTDDSEQQSKLALHQHTMSSSLDSASGDDVADQQRPWAFYLRTGVDPPQRTTSSSDRHSFPTQQFRDVNSSHHSLPQQAQAQRSRNMSLSKSYPHNLHIEPDFSFLQTAERFQGSGRVGSHSELSDSQTKDPETLDRDGTNKQISLQEAFLRHKQGFVVASKSRQQEIQVKARERESHVAEKRPSKLTSTPLKKNNLALPVTETSVQSSRSNLARERPAVAAVVRRQDEKTRRNEQRERNRRLYERLPEVRHKLEEERKQVFYAKNRNKAKQYGQSLQNRRRRHQVTGSTS